MIVRIELGETLARVDQPDAATGVDVCVCTVELRDVGDSRSVVGDRYVQSRTAYRSVYSNRTARLARRDCVLDRVLDDRLQQQARQQCAPRRHLDVARHGEALVEAHLLDVEIEVQ